MYLYADDIKGLGELSALAGGLGATGKPKRMVRGRRASRRQVARVKGVAAMISKKRMLQRQAAIAKKLKLPPKTIGFAGMGHILSTWQATKEGEGPWYNPGSTHNEKHRTNFWPDMAQYPASVLEDVKRLNGMSQYEIEHMKKPMLDALVAKAKAGQNVIAPSPAGPPPEPVEAANASLATSAAGRSLLATEAVYDAGAAAISAPFALINWIKRNKTMVMVGGGVLGLGLVALVAWPYIKAARAGGKALQRAVEA